MKHVQFIDTTPEQLKEEILSGFKSEIEALKKDFQPKAPTVLMTRNEVKDLFKVDISTIHNWTKKGKLKAYYAGGRVYYKRHEVESILISSNPKA